MAEYLIDPTRGNDTNNGTSNPWRSLSMIAHIPVGSNTVTLEDEEV